MVSTPRIPAPPNLPPLPSEGSPGPGRSEGLPPPPSRRVPIALKIPYTLFVLVLVPCYWHHYGPANFLYFCDVALLVTAVALWTESRLLVSTQAVAILLPQLFWMVDFAAMAAARKSPLGMTAYMFDPAIPLWLRALSSFHFWLPILLLWLVWRLGYDRRALPLEMACGWALLAFCFWLLPTLAGARRDSININYVFGPGNAGHQTWMPPLLWWTLVMAVFGVVICPVTHLVLDRLFGRRGER
jgi:hypothetical protein